MNINHPLNIELFAIFILSTIFIIPIFIERYWCRYLCPYAALMNIIQWIGKFLHIPRMKIHGTESACVNCKLCDRYCPMQIKISKKSYVNDPECIQCGLCIEKCPVQGGLSFKILRRRNK